MIFSQGLLWSTETFCLNTLRYNSNPPRHTWPSQAVLEHGLSLLEHVWHATSRQCSTIIKTLINKRLKNENVWHATHIPSNSLPLRLPQPPWHATRTLSRESIPPQGLIRAQKWINLSHLSNSKGTINRSNLTKEVDDISLGNVPLGTGI